jgi:acyl-CoA thioesterase-2
VSYAVEATHEGRSFSTRRVTALQAGVTLFHMECSFHAPEPGFHHEDGPLLSPPDPETLPSFRALADRYRDQLSAEAQERLRGHPPLEIKPTDPEQLLHPVTRAVVGFWVRAPSAAGLPPELHACALAYASDAWLASAACMRQGTRLDLAGLAIASLDHAMWVHAPVRADEWLYHELTSPWAGGGRGLCRGRFFDRAGRLIATTTQEALFRKTEV